MAEKKKSRAKANRLVSKYITDMAEKEDAFLKDGDDQRMCTRAEKLAEIIWKNALGFTEINPKTGDTIIHDPSLSYQKMLLDRMEGRIQDVSATKAKKAIADRIKDTTKSKINEIAENS
jgi:hypothetical protein